MLTRVPGWRTGVDSAVAAWINTCTYDPGWEHLLFDAYSICARPRTSQWQDGDRRQHV